MKPAALWAAAAVFTVAVAGYVTVFGWWDAWSVLLVAAAVAAGSVMSAMLADQIRSGRARNIMWGVTIIACTYVLLVAVGLLVLRVGIAG